METTKAWWEMQKYKSFTSEVRRRNIIFPTGFRRWKLVCCDKPFTINAIQTEHLFRVAHQKKLFFMKAVWTRFPSAAVSQKIFGSEVNNRHRPANVGKWEHRLYDPTPGGGALLDRGIYCITWAMLVFFKDPRNGGEMTKISTTMMKTKGEVGKDGWKGEVDSSTSIILTFEKLDAVAVLTTGLSVRTPGDGVVIQGDKGDIVIPNVPCIPASFQVHLPGAPAAVQDYSVPAGHGLHYEADACARAIRDGKLEVEECSLEASLLVMQIMDEVRRLGQL